MQCFTNKIPNFSNIFPNRPEKVKKMDIWMVFLKEKPLKSTYFNEKGLQIFP